jgi:hypothetical protein
VWETVCFSTAFFCFGAATRLHTEIEESRKKAEENRSKIERFPHWIGAGPPTPSCAVVVCAKNFKIVIKIPPK